MSDDWDLRDVAIDGAASARHSAMLNSAKDEHMAKRPWYQEEEPGGQSVVPTWEIDASQLEDQHIKPSGKYLVFAIKDDYMVTGMGTIPAETRGIVSWPAGASSTRYVDFYFPHDVIMNSFKRNNKMTLPILLFRHVGYINGM